MKRMVVGLARAQIIFVLLLLLMLVGSALAFLSAEEEAINHFEVGYNDCAITEEWLAPSLMEEGQEYSKKVAVDNTGSLPCYARIFAEITDADIREELEIRESGDWHKADDGWWYYAGIIEAGASSGQLEFLFVPRSQIEEGFEMLVYAETVEAFGNEGTASESELAELETVEAAFARIKP